MFVKKYIFETRKTKTRRYLQNSIMIFLLGLVIHLSLCFYTLYYAYQESQFATKSFYTTIPDLVAIFTGDKGRISFGLRQAYNYQWPQIFITGVYSANTIKTLLESQDKDILDKINVNSDLIEIDYWARNTIENVISTLRYLRQNKGHKNILIISNDYHILRIKMILNIIRDSKKNYNFYFMSKKTKLDNWRNIKIILKEGLKIIKAAGFLLVWEKDLQT